MNPDDQLNELFRVARQEEYEPRNLGFETRLLARMRETKQKREATGWFAWRTVPFFGAITLAVILWTMLSPHAGAKAEMNAAELDPQAFTYLTASR